MMRTPDPDWFPSHPGPTCDCRACAPPGSMRAVDRDTPRVLRWPEGPVRFWPFMLAGAFIGIPCGWWWWQTALWCAFAMGWLPW